MIGWSWIAGIGDIPRYACSYDNEPSSRWLMQFWQGLIEDEDEDEDESEGGDANGQ